MASRPEGSGTLPLAGAAHGEFPVERVLIPKAKRHRIDGNASPHQETVPKEFGMDTKHLSIHALKAEARALRSSSDDGDPPMTHSKALEVVARRHGARDWNTLSAALAQDSAQFPLACGQTVTGRYLGHDFVARLLSVQVRANGLFRVAVELDEAVDVAASPRFSAWRKRISATVNQFGVSPERTSDGTPHLYLET
ncbi:MAG: glyoxalase superfamily protein [Pseudomonadota bacterium]